MMPSRKSANKTTIMLRLAKSLRFSTLVSFCLILSLNCLLAQADQQQASSAEQQQQQISQGTYGNGGAADYAALVAGAENLLNLPVFNNKRARKMSAFMPMRGRKDGRDFQQQQQQQLATFEGADGSEMLLAGPFHEAEGDSSIMRLVGASLRAEPNWVAGTPAPRQFANQFRHMLVGGQPGQRYVSGSEPFGALLSGDLMQAKPRRAFHPMRGKKSSMGSFEVASDEIPAGYF